jgi:alpha-mannosidase
MDGDRQTFVSTLLTRLDRVRSLSQVDVKSAWRMGDGNLDVNTALAADTGAWVVPSFNDKGYLTWERGRRAMWLGQTLTIPTQIYGYPVADSICRLGLVWWAEDAQIFVNGRLVQAGDLFDSTTRILLTDRAVPGASFDLRLRLVSPGHDVGAVMRSLVIYESADSQFPEPAWLADELATMIQKIGRSHPERLSETSAILDGIDFSLLSGNPIDFVKQLIIIKQRIKALIPNTSDSINLLGHAHLDMAWLWEVAETWEVAERTFKSALKLQTEFPNLTFCHSTPALYAWMEENRGALFQEILTAARSGQWEVVGGMWIEPDLNLLSGESIARQILYGQVYDRGRFGQLTRVAWLPDTFGFTWQLPQLLLQGGIEYFVTQKFLWNDTTKFPHQLFWWEAPDGSRILSLMSSPIGEGIDPIKMANYHYQWVADTEIDESLWLMGVGDHGGGPTRDMLEIADRWSKSDIFPDLKFTTAVDYLDRLSERAGNKMLPVWRDELYLEFHRGCYTTHADCKRANRQSEDLLYQAELWSSVASILRREKMDKEITSQIETAWKYTLFNQFHDIIPGTAITPVYNRAEREWEIVERITTQIIGHAIEQISEQISLPTPPHHVAQPILIFNALNWERTEVISLALPDEGDWEIYDLEGNLIPSQRSGENLLFIADRLPSVGYHLWWLSPLASVRETQDIAVPIDEPNYVLENAYLRVEIDRETGDINRLWDKQHQREVLTPQGANQIQAFTDKGQYWDAWNIDPNYREHPLPPSELIAINWVERGEIRQRLRVVRKLAECEFSQDYILDAHTPILKVKTILDWQAEQVLVKANFPLNLTADFATYEIACGAIERTTQPQTAAETAKWEVPALRWADLTANSGDYGVSILNDCKYGHDAGTDYLRLTLLRSPNWPDRSADRGYHEFTYAIYPHSGTWQAAETVKRGCELNSPLQALQVSSRGAEGGVLPPVASLLDLGADNLILMAFKPAEISKEAWILRCYEGHGETAKINLSTPLNLHLDRVVNLLEEGQEDEDKEILMVKPWQIRSWESSRG